LISRKERQTETVLLKQRRDAMRVADIMTTDVVTVRPETSVREVARILLERRISGVPVVDEEDRPLGIVSEGDLVRRIETGTQTRRSWWLDFFGGGDAQAGRFTKEHGHTAGQVMTRTVVTTTEEVGLEEVARLLEKHRVKRLPVLWDGKVVGIVSRANLLRGLAASEPRPMSAGAPATDRDIRKAILDRISAAGVAPGFVDATVTGGKVQLWGITHSDVEERAAIVAAEEVPGVVAVESNLGRVPTYAWGY
jgi:CBS domain-containing protein